MWLDSPYVLLDSSRICFSRANGLGVCDKRPRIQNPARQDF
ncbi:hypothetical protein [uncultured Helicobacter sp.]|nr:hypothetical protein [uncultured Helicobacter sp.]